MSVARLIPVVRSVLVMMLALIKTLELMLEIMSVVGNC